MMTSLILSTSNYVFSMIKIAIFVIVCFSSFELIQSSFNRGDLYINIDALEVGATNGSFRVDLSLFIDDMVQRLSISSVDNFTLEGGSNEYTLCGSLPSPAGGYELCFENLWSAEHYKLVVHKVTYMDQNGTSQVIEFVEGDGQQNQLSFCTGLEMHQQAPEVIHYHEKVSMCFLWFFPKEEGTRSYDKIQSRLMQNETQLDVYENKVSIEQERGLQCFDIADLDSERIFFLEMTASKSCSSSDYSEEVVSPSQHFAMHAVTSGDDVNVEIMADCEDVSCTIKLYTNLAQKELFDFEYKVFVPTASDSYSEGIFPGSDCKDAKCEFNLTQLLSFSNYSIEVIITLYDDSFPALFTATFETKASISQDSTDNLKLILIILGVSMFLLAILVLCVYVYTVISAERKRRKKAEAMRLGSPEEPYHDIVTNSEPTKGVYDDLQPYKFTIGMKDLERTKEDKDEVYNEPNIEYFEYIEYRETNSANNVYDAYKQVEIPDPGEKEPDSVSRKSTTVRNPYLSVVQPNDYILVGSSKPIASHDAFKNPLAQGSQEKQPISSVSQTPMQADTCDLNREITENGASVELEKAVVSKYDIGRDADPVMVARVTNLDMDADNPDIDLEGTNMDVPNAIMGVANSVMDAEDPNVDAENPRMVIENPKMGVENPVIDAEDPDMDAENPRMVIENPNMGVENPVMDAEHPDMDVENTNVDED